MAIPPLLSRRAAITCAGSVLSAMMAAKIAGDLEESNLKQTSTLGLPTEIQNQAIDAAKELLHVRVGHATAASTIKIALALLGNKSQYLPSGLEQKQPELEGLPDPELAKLRRLDFLTDPRISRVASVANSLFYVPLVNLIAGTKRPTTLTSVADCQETIRSSFINKINLYFFEIALYVLFHQRRQNFYLKELDLISSHPSCVLEGLRTIIERESENESVEFYIRSKELNNDNVTLFSYIPDEARINDFKLAIKITNRHTGAKADGIITYFDTDPNLAKQSRKTNAGFYEKVNGKWCLINPRQIIENSIHIKLGFIKPPPCASTSQK